MFVDLQYESRGSPNRTFSKDGLTEPTGGSPYKCNEMSFDSAKKQACIMLGDIAKGNDPKTGKRINTLNDITLREVLQKFLEIKPIRKDTQRNYHFAINRHFNDWLDMPITGVGTRAFVITPIDSRLTHSKTNKLMLSID